MTIFKKVLVLILCFASIPVMAGDKELQAQVDEMKRVMDAQGKNLANTVNQLNQVLASFQSLSGQLDQAIHDNTDQQKLIQDMQKRADVAENKISLLEAQLEEIKAAGLLPPAQAKNYKEFKSFSQELSKYNAEEYKEAIDGLRQFMAANPKSIYWEFAQYWVGESYFALRDYPAAVAEYQSVVKKYPNGAKAPAAMLKQGMAFFELQSFDDSKAFLEKVATKYPGSGEAVLARAKVKKINALMEERTRQKNEKKIIDKLPEETPSAETETETDPPL